jgi:hypothetical protein
LFGVLRTPDNISSNALKAQIVQLSERIHLLELALAELQALVSEKPHPLLVSQSQDTQDTLEKEDIDNTELNVLAVDTPPSLSEEESFVDAFGKLCICWENSSIEYPDQKLCYSLRFSNSRSIWRDYLCRKWFALRGL